VKFRTPGKPYNHYLYSSANQQNVLFHNVVHAFHRHYLNFNLFYFILALNTGY